MTLKTGLVLVVRDEARDIITWMAWHHLLGFDTFFIFDDGSTDGTFEILLSLRNLYDIRLVRIDMPDVDYYYFRQEQVYRNVLAETKSDYDWLLFIDADEYLCLNSGSGVRQFLDNYPSHDAIAINWCQYGSSGYVLAPKTPSLIAFTQHSSNINPACAHVKSFVRPSAVGAKWLNVHAYDVPAERYCRPDHTNIEWGVIPGITKENADWNIAKIIHLQCRSMQQFIERAKKRSDIKIDMGTWSESNVNEFSSPLSISSSDKLRLEINRNINNIINYSQINVLNKTDLYFWQITDHHGNYLCYDINSQRVNARLDCEANNRLICVTSKLGSISVVFVNNDAVDQLVWGGCPPTNSIEFFHIVKNKMRSTIYIQNAVSMKYIEVMYNEDYLEVLMENSSPSSNGEFKLIKVDKLTDTSVSCQLSEVLYHINFVARGRALKSSNNNNITQLYATYLGLVDFDDIEISARDLVE